MIETIYRCDGCGAEFGSYGGDTGFVDHDNLYSNRKYYSEHLKQLCIEIVTDKSPESIDGIICLREDVEIEKRLNCVMLWETLDEKQKEKVRKYSERLVEHLKEMKSALSGFLENYEKERQTLFARVWEGF